MAFSKNYKTKFKFAEQSNQTYYHDIRVFITGVDVSPWLTSDVAVTYAKNGGVNSASFTLSNQYNAFVLTEDNLLKRKSDGSGGGGTDGWRLQNPYSPDGQYSELAKYQIWQAKNDKGRNVKHKVSSFGPLADSNQTKATILNQQDSPRDTYTHKYPFAPGSLVLHKFDQVRVFARNPLTMGDEWICVFTGFVDLKPYTQDLVYGMSTVRISCQDIRYAMQRMRTQANPAAIIGNENAFQFSNGGVVGDGAKDGYFNDLVGPNSHTSHILGGVTFLSSIKFLLLGEIPGRAANAAASADFDATGTAGTNLKRSLNAVGELEMGEEISYDTSDPEKAKQILEEWNDLVLFREFKMMTETAMWQIGQETHDWGEHSIWKAKVHILRPMAGLPISNLVEASVTSGNIKDKVQWASRLELLLNICDNLDYVFYISPWGDVIFEFPMWDFSPDSYGEKYKNVYTFQDHIISRDVNDEGGDAVSAVTVESAALLVDTRNIGQGDAPGRTDGHAPNTELTRTIFSNALASRIGVQIKTVVKPGVTQKELEQLGMIEFAKAMADYNKHSFKSQYRPYLMVNRPIYDVEAYKIGSLNTLTTTWRIRESVENELDLTYVRNGELTTTGADAGKLTFRFITGGERSTISYNTIYNDSSINYVTGQGVSSAANDSKEGDGT